MAVSKNCFVSCLLYLFSINVILIHNLIIKDVLSLTAVAQTVLYFSDNVTTNDTVGMTHQHKYRL